MSFGNIWVFACVSCACLKVDLNMFIHTFSNLVKPSNMTQDYTILLSTSFLGWKWEQQEYVELTQKRTHWIWYLGAKRVQLLALIVLQKLINLVIVYLVIFKVVLGPHENFNVLSLSGEWNECLFRCSSGNVIERTVWWQIGVVWWHK